MIRYSARAVPWVLVIVSTAIVVGLMALVAHRPWVMWPLQGTAVGVIAGVVAWSMDERSASIVDTLPRGLWWRTTARAAVVPPVLAAWTSCLLAMRARIPTQLGLFVLQGIGAVCVALAATVYQRSTGTAEPGRPFAAFVIPTATALALARPVPHWLPLFPLWPTDNWTLSRAIWSAACLGSLATVTPALITGRYRHRGHLG